MSPALVDELTAIVGGPHVVTDPEVVDQYLTDWTGRFRGSALAVVRPGSTDEVAAIVAACRAAEAAVVPQGGNTGLVGGGVPLRGGVVLSLRRFDQLEVDPASGQVLAGAGVTLAALHAAAREAGWAYGVDFGARDSATVGGSIATNAGGIHVLRYGMTRRQLIGVDAVLGTGVRVTHLTGLEKDNTGYDLAGLMCGSEGTLGVLTAARLRLVPALDQLVTALVAVSDMASAAELAAHLRTSVPDLHALEFMSSACVDLVAEHYGRPWPFGTPGAVALVVEAGSSGHDPAPHLAQALDTPHVLDVAVATDAGGRPWELWAWREQITEVLNGIGPPLKLDVTVPLPGLESFMTQVTEVVTSVSPAARTWLFGHLGDGNVHVNVTGCDAGDEHELIDRVLAVVADHRGSISAEHGIGAAKREWLHLSRSEAEIAAMRSIKSALDPDGILNPGVLLPDV